jgi:hypothetical protein
MLTLLILAVLEAAQPIPKGTVVYFPEVLVFYTTPGMVSLNTQVGKNLPYKYLDCPGTNDCRITIPACEALELRKQTAAKTVVTLGGNVFNAAKFTIKGDGRNRTFTSQGECRAAMPAAAK